MQVQSVSSQNFKGLQCHPNYGEVQYILAAKLDGYGFDKAMKYLSQLADNHAHSDVYIAGSDKKPKIYAEVGGKLFKENWFFGPVRVLKKALKTSDKIESYHNFNLETQKRRNQV